MNEDEPGTWAGVFVVEAGIRQAWPFLTFNDPANDSEYRMYIDTDLRVLPSYAEWTDQDDDRTLVALANLVMAGLARASEDSDGALRIEFDDAAPSVLIIRPQGNSKTTHDLWWMHRVR